MLFGMISVVGIFYFIVLMWGSPRGLLMWCIVWPMVLLLLLQVGFNILGSTDGVYIVNGSNGVPPWIFNPECLIMCPILVVVIRFAYTLVEGLHKG
jgi:hypothetical protein